MCGLAGVIGEINGEVVSAMLDNIAHRGPDDRTSVDGDWYSAGMVRLAIVDHAGGKQPFKSSASDTKVFMNGEVYNHAELRRELSPIYRFRSISDTEVVLALFETGGIEALKRLKGIFAIVIFSGNVSFLLRDRYGVKPLYLRSTHQSISFCSEMKGLLALEGGDLKLNEQTFADIHIQGYPSEYSNCFSAIETLRPGELLTVQRGHLGGASGKKTLFLHPLDACQDMLQLPIEQATESLAQILQSAVEYQTSGEVVCDFSLSGGVDSSGLVGLAALRLGLSPNTHVVADSEMNPDYIEAAAIAKALKLNLNPSMISYKEFCDNLALAVWIEERPSSFSPLPFLFVARSVSASAKVVLSGEGADELFGGYTDYVESPVKAKERLARAISLRRKGVDVNEFTIDQAKKESLASSEVQYTRMILHRIFWGRLQFNHLDIADRYFMSQGVECRVPYLDDDVVQFGQSLPLSWNVNRATGVQKGLLRCLVAGLHPQLAHCTLRRKQGLPAATSMHGRRLVLELMGYEPEASRDFARQLGVTGVRAFAWDLFHEIFIRGHGRIPSRTLAHDLAKNQNINLGALQ